MAAPPIPPSFLDELDAYSEAVTGMRGQYRPIFDDDRGVWTIQKRVSSDGRWQGIVVVKDDERQIAERTVAWFYRPLDHRVFADLMDADLHREFGSGDENRDYAMRTARIDRDKFAEKLRWRGNTIETFRSINREERGLLYRAKAERQFGHSHGTRMYHQVPR